MSKSVVDWAVIDRHFPYRGPCAFCGGADARHRLFDAMRGNYAAGDPPERIAAFYGEPLEAVRAVLAPRRCPARRRSPQDRERHPFPCRRRRRHG